MEFKLFYDRVEELTIKIQSLRKTLDVKQINKGF
jgi:hypothetical protein